RGGCGAKVEAVVHAADEDDGGVMADEGLWVSAVGVWWWLVLVVAVGGSRWERGVEGGGVTAAVVVVAAREGM
nr:hypothetical protein [Tanacetum cinerariifolium]